jgi:cytidyltransferase-like protein
VKKINKTTNNEKLKIGFVVGRFQPFHLGHAELISKAYSKCDHLIIFIGSSNISRTVNNPFTFEERRSVIFEFILSNWGEERIYDFSIEPLNDYIIENNWVKYINRKIFELESIFKKEHETIYFTSNKDLETAYGYFKNKYKINTIEEKKISGSLIRKMYFLSKGSDGYVHKTSLPYDTISFLMSFRNKKTYKEIKEKYINEEKENIIPINEFPIKLKTHVILVIENNENEYNEICLIEKDNKISTLNKISENNISKDIIKLLNEVYEKKYDIINEDIEELYDIKIQDKVIKEKNKLTKLMKINFVRVFFLNKEYDGIIENIKENVSFFKTYELQEKINNMNEETINVLKGIMNE